MKQYNTTTHFKGLTYVNNSKEFTQDEEEDWTQHGLLEMENDGQ